MVGTVIRAALFIAGLVAFLSADVSEESGSLGSIRKNSNCAAWFLHRDEADVAIMKPGGGDETYSQ